MLNLFLTPFSIKSNFHSTSPIDLITIFKVKFDAMSVNKKKSQKHEDAKKAFFDEETDKRNHEHLLNEKDEITEEDIRHVRTDISGQGNETDFNPDRFDLDDKLIGDDLELRKASEDSDPEIDSSLNKPGP
jgi:hypothetical protein